MAGKFNSFLSLADALLLLSSFFSAALRVRHSLFVWELPTFL